MTTEILALSHLQRKIGITNPIHGVVLHVAQASGNAQLLLANSNSNQTIANGNLILTTGTFVGAFSGDGSSVTSLNATQLTTGTVPLARITGLTNTQIDAAAAIAYSKLNLTGSIVNADVNAAAAIAYSKLNLTGSIVNADVNAGAAIAYSKLSLSNSIVVADIAAAAKATAATINTLVLRDGAGRFQAVDPSAAQDVATKAYVDSMAAGLDPKGSCRVASTANIATLSGLLTIDGVTLLANERVLVKNQTTTTANGIYTAAAGAWARATDFDGSPANEVTSGAFTFIEEGTVNANSGWVLTTDGTITIGSTGLTFAQFSGAGSFSAGAGLTLTGSTFDIVAADGTITVNADSIQVGQIANANVAAGAGIVYSKLALTNTIVNADIAAAAGIVYSKLSLSNSIVNADIAAGAGIVDTKLATITTAGKVADSALSANVTLYSGTTAFTAKQTFQTSVAGGASITLPHGTAPTSPVNGDVWTTTAGVFVRVNAVTQTLAVLATNTFTGTQVMPAATTSIASLRIPHGAAPTTPTNGDVWTTTAAVFVRINGVTETLATLSGDTYTGTIILPAATTAISSLRIPHGVAPTAPTNGDVWTTTAAVLVRISGVTVTLADANSLAAASLTGTIADARLSSNVPLKNGTNVFTGTNTFQGNTVVGDGNQDVLETQALAIETDTRNHTITYNGDGTLNVITEKDGATTVKTTTYAYNGDGTVNTVTEVANGKTITTTFGYTSGDITSISKTVV